MVLSLNYRYLCVCGNSMPKRRARQHLRTKELAACNSGCSFEPGETSRDASATNGVCKNSNFDKCARFVTTLKCSDDAQQHGTEPQLAHSSRQLTEGETLSRTKKKDKVGRDHG